MTRLGLLALLTFASFTLAACGDDDATPSPDAGISTGDGRWTCPERWVAHREGGCGPAVLLCPADLAAAGACDGLDLTTLPPETAPARFHLGGDGTLRGGWRDPGEPGGPPAETFVPAGGTGSTPADWTPGAGISSCAPGWSRLADTTCDPMLSTTCASGSEPIPGGACTPTAATDCPAGEYRDVAAEAGSATIVHVRAGADPATADGTAALPFATITAGVAAAGPSGWVLVATGEYAESLRLDASVHLVGRCAATVVVRPPAGITALEVASGDADVRGLSLRGGDRGAVATGGTLTLRAMIIDGARRTGISADAGMLAIDDSVISNSGSGGGPAGARAARIQRLTIRRSALVGNGGGGARSASLLVEGAALLTVEDTLVRGPAGSLIAEGGVANVSRTVLEDSAPQAVIASGFSEVHLTHAILRKLDALAGDGGAAYGGATITLDDTLIERDGGFDTNEAGTTATWTDCVVRGSRSPGSTPLLFGMVAANGSTQSATRVRIELASRIAAYATGADASIDAVSSEVRGTLRGDGSALWGTGVAADGGAEIHLSTTLVENAALVGVLASADAHIVIDSSLIRGTRAPAIDDPATEPDETTLGQGLQANCASRIEVTSTVLADNEGAAAYAITLDGLSCLLHDTAITLTDSTVLDTQAHPAGTHAGLAGFGLQVAGGARVDATRVLVARATDAGAFALDRDSEIALVDSAVVSTRPRAGGTGGRGLVAQERARITATHTLLRDLADTGALAIGATIALTDSAVIGVAPRTDGAYGVGVAVGLGGGGQTMLHGVLVEDVQEAGVVAIMGSADLTDVIIRDVAASSRGFGLGVGASGGAQVTLARVAVSGASGGGIASTPFELVDPPAPFPAVPLTSGTLVQGEDVLVTGVRTSTVAFDVVGGVITPQGRRVAYGLTVSPDCTISLSRIAIHQGGYGFFDDAGTCALTDVAISGQVDATGARTAGTTLTLARLFSHTNARDEIVEESTLPSTAALPPPTPVTF